MKKKNAKLPPRDSWIELGPGEAVHIDVEFEKRWQKEKRDFREVRGNFLASCFEIEFLLDIVLCEILFPGVGDPNAKPTDNLPVTMASGKALKELFDELILKRSTLSPISFGFKIELFKELSSQIVLFQSLLPEGFGNKLDKVRKIRNRFAHYPIGFKATGEPPNQNLSARLVCRDKTIVLDASFFDTYSKLFGSVMIGLEKILQELKENPDRT